MKKVQNKLSSLISQDFELNIENWSRAIESVGAVGAIKSRWSHITGVGGQRLQVYFCLTGILNT